MIAPIRVPGIPLRVRSTWLLAGILLLVAPPARAGEVSIGLIEVDGTAVEGDLERILDVAGAQVDVESRRPGAEGRRLDDAHLSRRAFLQG